MIRIISPILAASLAAVVSLNVPHNAKAGDAPHVRFVKQVLTDKYFCDGIVSGDLNRDDKADIVAGPFWYEGPDFKTKHGFYPAVEFPTEPSPTDSMFSYVHDVNADVWPDILVLGRVHLHEAFWYENSQGKPGDWKKHFAFHRVQGESPPFLDVDGDGRPELVGHWLNRWGLIPALADLDGDGLKDIVTGKRRWAHGPTGDIEPIADPVLYWFQLVRENGKARFVPHLIDKESGVGCQVTAADVNGDGRPDILTVSKRGAFVFLNLRAE